MEKDTERGRKRHREGERNVGRGGEVRERG